MGYIDEIHGAPYIYPMDHQYTPNVSIYIYISLYTYIYISCMDPMGDMFFDLQSSESIFLHTLKTKGQEWKSRSLYRERNIMTTPLAVFPARFVGNLHDHCMSWTTSTRWKDYMVVLSSLGKLLYNQDNQALWQICTQWGLKNNTHQRVTTL